ncbi:hypothetical protein DKT74_36945, partial [Streptomyces sp. ZEA17I]
GPAATDPYAPGRPAAALCGTLAPLATPTPAASGASGAPGGATPSEAPPQGSAALRDYRPHPS